MLSSKSKNVINYFKYSRMSMFLSAVLIFARNLDEYLKKCYFEFILEFCLEKKLKVSESILSSLCHFSCCLSFSY